MDFRARVAAVVWREISSLQRPGSMFHRSSPDGFLEVYRSRRAPDGGVNESLMRPSEQSEGVQVRAPRGTKEFEFPVAGT